MIRPAVSAASNTVRTVAARRFASTTVSSPVSNHTIVVRKRAGHWKGGLVGFLFGTLLAGSFTYKRILDEYRSANDVVVGQVIALNQSVSRLEAHVKSLESKVNKN